MVQYFNFYIFDHTIKFFLYVPEHVWNKIIEPEQTPEQEQNWNKIMRFPSIMAC